MITKLAHPDLGAPGLAMDIQSVAPVAAQRRSAGAAAYLLQLTKRVLAAIDRAIFDADEDCMRF